MKNYLYIIFVLLLYQVRVSAEEFAEPDNRWYNVCEGIYHTQDSSIFTTPTLPFLWKGDAVAQFYNNGVAVFDTISLSSLYQVLDPYSKEIFNNPLYPDTVIEITTNDYYTIDSIYFFGYYFRNSKKSHVVDTLRVSILRNADLFYSRYVSDSSRPWIDSLYGVDTLLWVSLFLDSVKDIGVDANGMANYVYDIYLDSNSVNSKTDNGRFNQYFISNLGISPLKQERFGLSLTYLSGDPDFDEGDTIYMKGSNQQDSIIYNFFQPLAFEKSLASAPIYFPNEFNVSGAYFSGAEAALYMPSFNFSPSYAYDYWYIDYYLTCQSCYTLENEIKDEPSATYRLNKHNKEIIVDIPSALLNTTPDISMVDVMGRHIEISETKSQNQYHIKYPDLPQSIYFLTIGNQRCLRLALD